MHFPIKEECFSSPHMLQFYTVEGFTQLSWSEKRATIIPLTYKGLSWCCIIFFLSIRDAVGMTPCYLGVCKEVFRFPGYIIYSTQLKSRQSKHVGLISA